MYEMNKNDIFRKWEKGQSTNTFYNTYENNKMHPNFNHTSMDKLKEKNKQNKKNWKKTESRDFPTYHSHL